LLFLLNNLVGKVYKEEYIAQEYNISTLLSVLVLKMIQEHETIGVAVAEIEAASFDASENLEVRLQNFDGNWANAAVQTIKENSKLSELGYFIHENEDLTVWVVPAQYNPKDKDRIPSQLSDIYVFDSNDPGIKNGNERFVNEGGVYKVGHDVFDRSPNISRLQYPNYQELSVTENGQVSYTGKEIKAFESSLRINHENDTVRDYFLDILNGKPNFFRSRDDVEKSVLGLMERNGVNLKFYLLEPIPFPKGPAGD